MVLCCAEAAPRGRKNRARFPQNHAKWGKNTRSRRQFVSGTSIFRLIFHFGQGTAAFFCTRMGKYGAWRLLWPPIFRRLAPLKRVAYSVSSSVCHSVHWASLGIRQSPRGDRATVPTLGPSGRQLRLNCCEKKRR